MLDGVDSSGFAGAGHLHNLQDLSGAVTDAQVPNNITIDHAASADTATSAGSASMALTLSGQLTDPGDQIPLGGGVFLQVAEDGTVEFLTGGRRLRLAEQKWFDPRNLLDNISPDGRDADGPQVALNEKGETVIVWQQTDGANGHIFRSEYRDGVWRDPANIADRINPDGNSAGDPQVASNDNGEAVVVWSQLDAANKLQIFRSEYRNGTWSDPADLSDNISPDGQDTFLAKVAMNDNGDAIVVWYQSDGAKNQIFRSEYLNGIWSDPADLSDNISPDGEDAFEPQVALNNAGEAVIVWRQSDGSTVQIFRSEKRNGLWIDPTDLSDNLSPDGQNAFEPQVALNANGEAVIVWYQFAGANNQIFRSEFRNGAWIDPAGLSDNISPDGTNASLPQVGLDNDGEAAIVWAQSDGMKDQIFRSEFRNNAWSDPANLSDNISPDDQDADRPQVALSNKGQALIVWEQSDGTNKQIFRSEYRDGLWRDPLDLSDNLSPNSADANRARVALNDNSDAVIVWDQSDGANLQIFRSEFRFGF
jgi:uncharacterized protein YheU (UPF0270 family)